MSLDRRSFLQGALLGGAALATGASLAGTSKAAQAAAAGSDWHMPDEGESHACTWMAFGPSAAIWGDELLPLVRQNLATLARTIGRHEPVRMLVRQRERGIAKELLGDAKGVELIDCPIDDLWIRDTGPTFVINERDGLVAVDFNFNGWGRKQKHAQDAKVAAFVARQAKAPRQRANLVMEGGCIEVDGEGTAIITESCTLNRNRNPGMSKAQFEDRLMPLMGLDKIIWLPGIKGRDITDGHTDFYARFARPGVVVAGLEQDPDIHDYDVTRAHLEILRKATDAKGRKLEILTLESPTDVRPQWQDNNEFAAGYIGYYACNGAIVMQQFGDADADTRAQATLARAFPGRKIEALNMDGIAAGGGSIHCATQQQPA